MAGTSEVDAEEYCQNVFDVPAIFQCANCTILIGDSSACVWTSSTMDVIALENVNPEAIEITKEVQTSAEEFDRGSTLRTIKCKGCRSTLGTYYIATTKALDHLREMYTLDCSSITRYVIGTYGGRTSRESMINSDEATYQLRKVQGIAVLLEKRLKRIENILKIDHTGQEDTQNNEPSTTYDQELNSSQKAKHERSLDASGGKDEHLLDQSALKRKRDREHSSRKKHRY